MTSPPSPPKFLLPERETDADSNTDTAEVGRDSPVLSDADLAGEQVLPSAQPAYVMPLASVLVSASVGLLTFLSYGAGSADTVFNWLVNVASVASLQSWAGMLFTYIRCVPFSFPLHPQVEFLFRVAVMVCGCARLTGLVGAGGTRARCTTSGSGGGTTRWRGGRRVSRSRRLRGIGIGASLMCVVHSCPRFPASSWPWARRLVLADHAVAFVAGLVCVHPMYARPVHKRMVSRCPRSGLG